MRVFFIEFVGGFFFIVSVGFLVVNGWLGVVKLGGWLVVGGCAVGFNHFSKLLRWWLIVGTIWDLILSSLVFLGIRLGADIVSNLFRSFCTTLLLEGLVSSGGGSKKFLNWATFGLGLGLGGDRLQVGFPAKFLGMLRPK